MEEEILYEGPVPDADEAEEEIAELKKRAETDEFGALDLGIRYITGKGVEPDTAQALKWFGKSGSALARYSSALIYYKRKDYPGTEKELLRGVDAGNVMDMPSMALCALMLGKLYLQDFRPEGQRSCRLAAQYLEQGLGLDPTQGAEYAGLLGMAYEELGMPLDAVHWYRLAVEEFNQIQYRERLYPIYLTGIAGAVKKHEAEEAMR